MAAWLGLVPQRYSTGGRTQILGISNRGNRYVRRLLILGADLAYCISIGRAIACERGSPSSNRACTSIKSRWRGRMTGQSIGAS